MKYLFIAHGESGEPAKLTLCSSRPEVLTTVQRTVFMAGSVLSADQVQEVEGYTEELFENGIVRFEGDPPLQLICVHDDIDEFTPDDYDMEVESAT